MCVGYSIQFDCTSVTRPYVVNCLFPDRDRRTIVYRNRTVRRGHLVIDDAYHVTLGWSDFMGEYGTPFNTVVKDMRSYEVMK